jgi:hypothetical protein
MNGSEYRTLYKAYGLRFIVSVTANAGQFSVLPLMLTIGAGNADNLFQTTLNASFQYAVANF